MTRTDCECCGDNAAVLRYDEHNGWQPFCFDCDPHQPSHWPPSDWVAEVLELAGQLR